MATDVMPADTATELDSGRAFFKPRAREELALWKKIVQPLASLKLTVALFAMAIFIVFVGTLAQVDQDIWVVIRQYFRTAFAWIDLKIFFPPSWESADAQFFGSSAVHWLMGKGFYFPGGWLIGTVMAVNLVAAHLVRFKIQARGNRLATGIVAFAAAIGVTWWVVAHASFTGGVVDQTASPEFWSWLWMGIKSCLLAVVIAGVYRLATMDWNNRLAWWLLLFATLAIAMLGSWFQMSGLNPDGSAMRILWQLIQGSAAGLAIYGACLLIFKNRAGIVVIHLGVGLMMFNELFVGMTNVESQMTLREGEARNYSEDIRGVELAVVDSSDPRMEAVTVIPKSLLTDGAVISDARLPFDIQVVKFIQNAGLRAAMPDDANPATAGAGLQNIAVELRPGAGADSSSKVDVSAAYLKLLKKDSKESLGTRLVGVEVPQHDQIEVGKTKYDIALRFKRVYKPYSIHLDSVSKSDYAGTETPRDYSSFIHLIDGDRHVDLQDKRIWMNNPLRYEGETLYQTNFSQMPDGTKYSTLSIVANRAWMIPYVGCMIVVVGLLAHFMTVLGRFIRRRTDEDRVAASPVARSNVLVAELAEPKSASSRSNGKNRAAHRPAARNDFGDHISEPLSEPRSAVVTYLPWVVVAVFAGWAVSMAIPPSASSDSMNYYEFGKLPVQDGGRIKPFDTLAQNTLRVISEKSTYKDADKHSHTAVQWLLDVIADPKAAEEHRVFRIDNVDVQTALHLTPRQDLTYSMSEIVEHFDELAKQVNLAKDVDGAKLSLVQKKILDLGKRVSLFLDIQEGFTPIAWPELPTREEIDKDPEAAKSRFIAEFGKWRKQTERVHAGFEQRPRPMAVPLADGKLQWEPFALAHDEAFAQTVLQQKDKLNPALESLRSIFAAYGSHDVKAFNSEVVKYRDWLEAAQPVKGLDMPKVQFETYFNFFSPFYAAAVLYLVALLLAFVGLLGFGSNWGAALNRGAFWLIVVALAIHGWGLVARMQISGRPPVTNLYSAAVFIGFGAVLLGLAFEAVYSIAFGNIVAGAAGFAALLIAHLLVSSTDTFGVLEAVLDTQFWLATHVVCVTLGYATTFIAGLLGLTYVILSLFTTQLNMPLVGRTWDTTGLRTLLGSKPASATKLVSRGTLGKDLARMIYATVCFAIFFSFFGTVLGGLWADDSWGRFWGWDPKENGALIIVLWNALVLHARWGGMVKDRGLAILAVAGNIAVGWSMFGVNELGAGLHSYGFTDGVAMTLWAVVGIHLAIIIAAAVTKPNWEQSNPTRTIG